MAETHWIAGSTTASSTPLISFGNFSRFPYRRDAPGTSRESSDQADSTRQTGGPANTYGERTREFVYCRQHRRTGDANDERGTKRLHREGIRPLLGVLAPGRTAGRAVAGGRDDLPGPQPRTVARVRPPARCPHQRADLRVHDRRNLRLQFLHTGKTDQDPARLSGPREGPALAVQHRHRPGGPLPVRRDEHLQGVRGARVAPRHRGGGPVGDVRRERDWNARQAEGEADVRLPLVPDRLRGRSEEH